MALNIELEAAKTATVVTELPARLLGPKGYPINLWSHPGLTADAEGRVLKIEEAPNGTYPVKLTTKKAGKEFVGTFELIIAVPKP